MFSGASVVSLWASLRSLGMLGSLSGPRQGLQGLALGHTGIYEASGVSLCVGLGSLEHLGSLYGQAGISSPSRVFLLAGLGSLQPLESLSEPDGSSGAS